MGWGAWSSLLNFIRLPQGAGPDDPQILIGNRIPAELQAYYNGFAGDTVVAVVLYQRTSTAYEWDALVSRVGIGGEFYRAVGRTTAGPTVQEFYRWVGATGLPFDMHMDRTPLNARYGDGTGVWLFEYLQNANMTTEGVIRALDTGLIQAQTPASFQVNTNIVASQTNGFNAELTGMNPAGAGGLVYANMPATSSFSFEKDYDDTAVNIDMAISWIGTLANMEGEFGVLIDGTDYTVCKRAINPINIHGMAVGFFKIPAGTIAAGTWTVQARWRRTAASAAGQLSTAADRCSARATECA